MRAGEVVGRADRDDRQRHAELAGDGRDRPDRAVTARDDDAVRRRGGDAVEVVAGEQLRLRQGRASSGAGSKPPPDAVLAATAIRTTAEGTLAVVLRSIDHIGVAVEDLDAAIAVHRDTYGMPLVHRETIDEQGVEAALLDVGDSHVELLAPLGADTPVGKFLAKRGPGLHHVAYRVEDVAATLDDLRAAGVRLIDEQPRTGIRGSRVAFLHPSASGGVLTEMVQPHE